MVFKNYLYLYNVNMYYNLDYDYNNVDGYISNANSDG